MVSFPHRTFILSARNDRYKLIRYPTGPKATLELFDLEKDPVERNNVASTDLQRASSLFTALDLYLVTGRPPSLPTWTTRRRGGSVPWGTWTSPAREAFPLASRQLFLEVTA